MKEGVHTFKERVILLCQSILETRRISHLPGSVHFQIPLRIVLNHINIGYINDPTRINNLQKLQP